LVPKAAWDACLCGTKVWTIDEYASSSEQVGVGSPKLLKDARRRLELRFCSKDLCEALGDIQLISSPNQTADFYVPDSGTGPR
jgi:hypothetical protein